MKKDDEHDYSSHFAHVDKSVVLQEARIFNETPIKASKCCLTLTKVLYMLYQGENLSSEEANTLFFMVTKLFQSKDVQLRRMVYLVIKELSPIARDVIMATSSLTKDMNDRVAAEVGYRANAIRTLCTITDPSMVQAIERFIKQAIVDKNSGVCSSALVSSIHLFTKGNKEVVKRWVSEVQEALNKPSLAQYHALGLLYLIKQHDKMAVTKVIQTLIKGSSLRSHFSYCMIVRLTHKIIEEDGGLEGPSRALFEVLENALRHRHDMVNLEAARAICSLKGATSKEIFPAVSVLQLFLNSPKSVLRFAAVRTLSKLAMIYPSAVTSCNVDMENLITDSNRSIATFAITTLLKTGNETSVDRLMKQITGFMNEISDEFKIIVVDAVRALCLKFPAKQAMMLQFLSGCLNDGGYEFKKAAVEAIFDIISAIPESKEVALGHLCEFIEDCEYTRLAVRILFLLGDEGPKMNQPTKYIKFIYNRTILENAPVRAAAISALAKFAVSLGEETRSNLKVLLDRCLDDPDDEVRDRAIMYLTLLNEKPLPDVKKILLDDSIYALDTLEQQLFEYVNNPMVVAERPFDFKSIPVIPKAQQEIKSKNATLEFAQQAGIAPSSPNTIQSQVGKLPQASSSTAESVISKMSEFASFGPLFKSSTPVDLTETDVAEYVVSCVKHTFAQHIVFQYTCRNTMDDVVLENVTVMMEPEDSETFQHFIPLSNIPIPRLKHDIPESTFVIFKKVSIESVPMCSFGTTLKFVSKDCDPETGDIDDAGFDDSYQMETIEIGISDYILASYSPSFSKIWEEIGNAHEKVETFQLESLKHIPEAIKTMKDLFGMSVLDNSDKLAEENSPLKVTSHTLLMSGIFVGGCRCVLKIRMAAPGNGIAMEFSVRSDKEDISNLLVESI